MDDSAHIVEPADHSSMKRREFLTKAAAAGAIAWTAPVILSRAAYGVEGGEGTPKCRPTVKVCCTRYWCQQAQKYFPGIHIVISDCPCRPGTCPTACVKIVNIETSEGQGIDIIAYGPGTDCSPGGTNNTVDFSGGFHCLTSPTTSIFFGKERGGGGAIGDIGGHTVCFDMAVWAGCPDLSPQNGPSYVCETHRYCVELRNLPGGDQNVPHCTCDTPRGPTMSLCDDISPCPPNCGPHPQATCVANPGCPPSIEADSDDAISSQRIVCPPSPPSS